jgi:hypothetical protein
MSIGVKCIPAFYTKVLRTLALEAVQNVSIMPAMHESDEKTKRLGKGDITQTPHRDLFLFADGASRLS